MMIAVHLHYPSACTPISSASANGMLTVAVMIGTTDSADSTKIRMASAIFSAIAWHVNYGTSHNYQQTEQSPCIIVTFT